MPIIRRRAVNRRDDWAALSYELTEDLLYGRPMFGSGFGDDQRSFSEAWAANRDRLLQPFIDEKPGCRPYAEWVCEIVLKYGERPILNSVPKHVERRFGILDSHVFSLTPGGLRMYAQEPDVLFLARLDLLQPGELARAKQKMASNLDPGKFIWPDWINT